MTTRTVLRFLNIVLAALLAGATFGIATGYNPAGLSPTAYVEQQQNAIRGLNVLLPLLGLVAIVLTLTSAYLQRNVKGQYLTFLIAALFLIASGLITRFGNQPINAIVMTWDPKMPPADWMALRDRWWSLHLMRTASMFVGLCLIVWAGIKKD